MQGICIMVWGLGALHAGTRLNLWGQELEASPIPAFIITCTVARLTVFLNPVTDGVRKPYHHQQQGVDLLKYLPNSWCACWCRGYAALLFREIMGAMWGWCCRNAGLCMC